eukprot:697238-Amphidinium_carterae.2
MARIFLPSGHVEQAERQWAKRYAQWELSISTLTSCPPGCSLAVSPLSHSFVLEGEGRAGQAKAHA